MLNNTVVNTTMKEASRQFELKVEIDSENIIGSDDLISFEFSDMVEGEQKLSIGSLCSQKVTITMYNYDNYFLYKGCVLKPYVGVITNDITEWIPLGIFKINNISSSNDYLTTVLECYDDVQRLSNNFNHKTLKYPCTLSVLIAELEKQSKITLDRSNFGTLVNNALKYNVATIENYYTLAQMWGFVAGLCGVNVKINRYGKMKFFWYANSVLDIDENTLMQNGFVRSADSDIKILSITSGGGEEQSIDDKLKEKNVQINDKAKEAAAKETEINNKKTEVNKKHNEIIKLNIEYRNTLEKLKEQLDKKEISKATYNKKKQEAETAYLKDKFNLTNEAIQLSKELQQLNKELQQLKNELNNLYKDLDYLRILAGKRLITNSITLGKAGGYGIVHTNPLMTRNFLDNIARYGGILNFTYTPCTINYRGNILLEAGDVVRVIDRQGNYHKVPVTTQILKISGGMSGAITGIGETEETSSVSQAPLTQKIEETYITANRVEANFGKFKDLTTDNLTTITANITNLTGKVANIDTIYAKKIDVDNLLVDYLKADEADIKYATIDYIKSDYLTVTNADIKYATIQELTSKYLTAENADIKYATIDNLTANYLTAQQADIKYATIEDLTAKYLTTEQADIKYLTTDTLKGKYAEIDFANINTATIKKGFLEELMVEQGILTSDIHSATGSFTNYLTAVNLVADNITAGTLSVDRLIINGSDKSIIYALNNMGELVSTSVDSLDGGVLTERSITADKLVANSVTANEINVTDLWAQVVKTQSIDASTGFIKNLTADYINGGYLTSLNYSENNAGMKISLIDGTIDTKNFKVDYDGNITSIGGNIAGFNFDVNGFYKTNGNLSIILNEDGLKTCDTNSSELMISSSGNIELHSLLNDDTITALMLFTNKDRARTVLVDYSGVSSNSFYLSDNSYDKDFWGDFSLLCNENEKVSLSAYHGCTFDVPVTIKQSSYFEKAIFIGTDKSTTTDGQPGCVIGAYGSMELSGKQPYIDFHYGNSTADFTHRIMADTSNRIKISSNLAVGGDLGLNGVITSAGKKLTGVSSSGNIYLGAGEVANGTGDTNIYAMAKDGRVQFRADSGTTVQLDKHGDGSTVFKPANAGGAGLGSPSYRWGTVYSNASFNSSDLKYKDVLGSIETDKAKTLIMGLQPIEYKRTDEYSTGKRIHMGFGAQTVAELCASKNLGDLSLYQAIQKEDTEEVPYYGTGRIDDKDLVWSLNYIELIAPLIKVVQEQQQEIDKLKEMLS